MIQRHNRHMSFSLYIAVLAVADTLTLFLGKTFSILRFKNTYCKDMKTQVRTEVLQKQHQWSIRKECREVKVFKYIPLFHSPDVHTHLMNPIFCIIPARKWSGKGNVFRLICLSFCPQGVLRYRVLSTSRSRPHLTLCNACHLCTGSWL